MKIEIKKEIYVYKSKDNYTYIHDFKDYEAESIINYKKGYKDLLQENLLILKNEPLSGFCFYQNDIHTYIRHPEGFEFEIPTEDMVNIASCCGVTSSMINGELVFVKKGVNIKLVPSIDPDYIYALEKLKEFEKLTISGNTYLFKNKKYRYLSLFPTLDDNGVFIGNKHWYLDEKDDFISINPKKTKETLELPEDVSFFIEKFKSSDKFILLRENYFTYFKKLEDIKDSSCFILNNYSGNEFHKKINKKEVGYIHFLKKDDKLVIQILEKGKLIEKKLNKKDLFEKYKPLKINNPEKDFDISNFCLIDFERYGV